MGGVLVADDGVGGAGGGVHPTSTVEVKTRKQVIAWRILESFGSANKCPRRLLPNIKTYQADVE